MEITEIMVKVFNQILENLNCSFKLEFNDGGMVADSPVCSIVPSSNLFIESSIINPTKEFYNVLEGFFRKRGVELSYNNDGLSFWSK